MARKPAGWKARTLAANGASVSAGVPSRKIVGRRVPANSSGGGRPGPWPGRGAGRRPRPGGSRTSRRRPRPGSASSGRRGGGGEGPGRGGGVAGRAERLRWVGGAPGPGGVPGDHRELVAEVVELVVPGRPGVADVAVEEDERRGRS